MVVKTKKTSKSKDTNKTKSKNSFLKKNKKVLTAIGGIASILAVVSGYKIYSDKKKKERNKVEERNKVVKEYTQNLRKITENKNKFLACDTNIKSLGNKSNLDILPFEKLDDILKNFTSMSDINNTCLVNEQIKKYCCNNRQRIFIEIFKNLGYTKGINNKNAEFLFTYLQYKNGYKINIFYINEFNHRDIAVLLIFIVITLNNKLTVANIDHTKNENYWKLYPVIYYYSDNSTIKKYILSEYNKITFSNILNDNIDYFTSFNILMTNYIINNIMDKIQQFTDTGIPQLNNTDIHNYSKLYINTYKNTFPQIQSLLPN